MFAPEPRHDLRQLMTEGMQPMDAYKLWLAGFVDAASEQEFARNIERVEHARIYERGYTDGEEHRRIQSQLGERPGAKELGGAEETACLGHRVAAWAYRNREEVDLCLTALGVLFLGVIAIRAGRL